MASLSSPSRLFSAPISFPARSPAISSLNPNPNPSPDRIAFISKEITPSNPLYSSGSVQRRLSASKICEQEPLGVDLRFPSVKECLSDEELHAAVRLRIRTFNNFNQSCGVEDYRRYLTEREYEALKERVAGKRIQFKRVSCINATLPSSTLQTFSELCSSCKFSNDGKDCVVVGTLDVNQCCRLADELTGKKPEASPTCTFMLLWTMKLPKGCMRSLVFSTRTKNPPGKPDF